MPKAKRSFGPRKGQVFKLSLPDFRDAEDARIAARWGASADYAGLGSLLFLFYDTKREPCSIEEAAGLTSQKKLKGGEVLSSRLGKMMVEALHNRDASFFRKLADLIPLCDSMPSPLDHAILTLLQARDGDARAAFEQRLAAMEADTLLSEGLKLSLRVSFRAQCDRAEADFPTWPPTAPYLCSWLKDHGIECVEKSVSRVATRHGIRLAPAKRGAPKKK